MKRLILKEEASQIIAGINWGDFASGFCIGFSVAVAFASGGDIPSRVLRGVASAGGIACDIKDLKDIL